MKAVCMCMCTCAVGVVVGVVGVVVGVVVGTLLQAICCVRVRVYVHVRGGVAHVFFVAQVQHRKGRLQPQPSLPYTYVAACFSWVASRQAPLCTAHAPWLARAEHPGGAGDKQPRLAHGVPRPSIRRGHSLRPTTIDSLNPPQPRWRCVWGRAVTRTTDSCQCRRTRVERTISQPWNRVGCGPSGATAGAAGVFCDIQLSLLLVSLMLLL